MKLLKTPEERFENLPDFPYEPHYLEVEGINIHYLDEGPWRTVLVLFI
jgi:haloalkane dehalogenase